MKFWVISTHAILIWDRLKKIGQANRLHNDEKGAGTPWMYMIPQKTTMPKWLQQESRGANT